MQTPSTHFAPDYGQASEAALVDMARAGDAEAFRAIMQRCNQRLFRVARSVVGNDCEAEDVLQEAYIRAFSKLGGFRGESSLLTWLTTIALNEARGRLRRRRPTIAFSDIEDAHKGAEILMFPSARPDPEEDMARSQMRQHLEQAIDELPEAFRLVFIMRDVEECSIEETAAHLDLKPETVRTRLFRARRLLRKALDEKLSATLKDSFPFLGKRCARLADAVLRTLAERAP